MTENSWNNFDKVEPNECGFYNVKVVHTNPFSTWDDGTLKTSVRWDGGRFLIAYRQTHYKRSYVLEKDLNHLFYGEIEVILCLIE